MGSRQANAFRWGRKNPCCTAIPGVPMKSRLLVLPLALLIAMPSLAATRGFEVRDMVNLDRYSSPALSPDGRRLVFAKRVLDEASGTASTSLGIRSEEHTSELQSLMRNSYDVFIMKKKTKTTH